jgi:hypothetical protein
MPRSVSRLQDRGQQVLYVCAVSAGGLHACCLIIIMARARLCALQRLHDCTWRGHGYSPLPPPTPLPTLCHARMRLLFGLRGTYVEILKKDKASG